MPTSKSSDLPPGWLIGVAVVVFSVSTYWAISEPADAVESSKPTDPPAEHYVPDEVRRLLGFVDSARAGTISGRGHEFAATGVRYVAAALGAVASSSWTSAPGAADRVDELVLAHPTSAANA
jgi:hypothetical protein